MKKFVKLSLAAAVASTGLVSANAGALEDAIKNTSILGYATYRYDDRSLDNSTGGYNDDTNNKHKIAVGFVSKINDDMSYTYVAAVTDTAETTRSGVNYMGGNLYSVYSYFTYTGIDNLTVNVGQQTIDTPQTDTFDDIGATQEGTGITAAYNAGPVTVVAGFMNQTKLTGEGFTSNDTIDSADLSVIAAKAKVAGISFDANFIDLDKVAESYTIGASTSFDADSIKISPYARYTATNFDGGLDNALWYVGTKVKAGAFGANVSYSSTAKDGGGVAFDDDASSVNQGWAINLNDNGKTGDLIKLGASYTISSSLSAAINHNMKTDDTGATDVDTDETYGQLTWKPSKNFYAYLRYGVVDYDGSNDGQRGRIHMTYNF